MITYKWDIKFKPTASINGYDNVVLAIVWILEAQNDENKLKSSMTGTTFFLPPTDIFIPYEDLTDEIVIGWIENKDDITSIKAELASKV
jgi:hypothetical protein